MLSDKYRMAMHWGLPSIIWYDGRRQALPYKIMRMSANRVYAFVPYICLVLFSQ